MCPFPPFYAHSRMNAAHCLDLWSTVGFMPSLGGAAWTVTHSSPGLASGQDIEGDCLHGMFSSTGPLYPQSSTETLLCAHHLYRHDYRGVFCFLPSWKALRHKIQPDTAIWNSRKNAVLKMCIIFMGFMDRCSWLSTEHFYLFLW